MKGFLPKAGGYRNLRVFKMSEAISDLTVIFTQRFVPAKSRTRDQMEQAARSGKQMYQARINYRNINPK